MNPDDNNPTAMTESIVTDDRLVAPVSLADTLDDDRLSCVRRTDLKEAPGS